jgi:RNA polymerase sigma factor (TIGR02999 family)
VLTSSLKLSSCPEITEFLLRWSNGDQAAANSSMPMVYRELHRLVRYHMSKQDNGYTLRATAVIHEAYFKLAGDDRHWENRGRFFSIAATAMRQVLVDHARKRLTGKRGGEIQRMSLDEGIGIAAGGERELIALDDALTTLGRLNARQRQVIELRYFAGLSVAETAEVLRLAGNGGSRLEVREGVSIQAE